MMSINELHWTTQASYPILASLQFFPLLMMVAVHLLGNDKKRYQLLALAMMGTLIEFALAISLYWHYQPYNSAMQLAEQLTLLSPFQYHVAVDGVSVMFIILTALFSILLVLYSFMIPMGRQKKFITLQFLVIATLMAQFTAIDLFWFLINAAIQLTLVGYIMWYWATSPERDLALSRYFQFMGTGLLLLIAGIIMLGWNHSDIHQVWSFDLYKLIDTPIDNYQQSIIFFLLFYGLAIRIPLFPLHGWLPLAASHGTVVIAPVLLIGLKVGIYGLIRFVFPLLPEAVVHWHEYVVTFAVAGVFYAALLALMQVNLRRLLAFAVVSHTSILIIGLFSLNHEAFQGGMMLSVNFGLAITGLFISSGFVYWRIRTMMLSKMGGLFDQFPLFGITFFIAGLAIIGMPGTPGFDSVHLILEAAIHRFGALITVAAAIGNVIAAGFLLWAFQRAFLAPTSVSVSGHKAIQPATWQEKLLTTSVIAILLGVGFYSEPWLDLIEVSLKNLDQMYDHLKY